MWRLIAELVAITVIGPVAQDRTPPSERRIARLGEDGKAEGQAGDDRGGKAARGKGDQTKEEQGAEHPGGFSDPEAMKRLLLGLYEKEVEKQLKAIEGLGQTKDLRVIPLLFGFSGHANPEIRRVAIQAMGQIRDYSVTLHLSNILISRSKSTPDRKSAVEALVAQNANLAADALYDSLPQLPKSLSRKVRRALEEKYADRLRYRKALSEGNVQAVSEEEQDGELAELLVALADSTFPDRRTEAAMALAKLGDSRVIPALEGLLSSKPEALRSAALDALAKLAHPRAAYVLAREARSASWPMEQRAKFVAALISHDTELAAGLVLDLAWEHPAVFEKGSLREDAEKLFGRRMSSRTKARSAELETSDAAAETELLIDLLQRGSTARREAALRRAGRLKADILPGLVPELEHEAYAQFLLPALGGYQRPEARQVLADYILEPGHPRELRNQSVEYLGRQPEPEAANLLVGLYAKIQDEELRLQIKQSLTQYHAKKAEEAGLLHLVVPPKDRSGVIPLAVALGVHGGLGIYLVSSATDPSEGGMIYLPIIGGTLLGVGSSLLLTWKEEEFTAPQAAWVTTGGIWALSEIALAGLALAGEDADKDAERLGRALAFTAQVGGLTFGWLTRNSLGKEWGQQLFMDTSLLVGGVGGLGLALQAKDPSQQGLAAWALAGSTSGLLLSGFLGRGLDFEGSDYLQTLNSMGVGAWLGYQGFKAIQPESDLGVPGGALLGLALGFGAGSVLSAYTQPSYAELAFMDVSLAAGTIAGLGLAYQKEARTEPWDSLWMLGGGATGLITAGVFGRHLDPSPMDFLQLGSTMAMSSWYGYLLTGSIQPESSSAGYGGLMLGASLGYAGGLAASVFTEPTAGDVGFLTTSFIAGNLGGLGLAWQKADRTDRWNSLWMLGGGTTGVLAAGLFGNRLKFSTSDYWQAASSLLVGGWGGYLVATAIQPDQDQAGLGGLLFGSSLGFAAGSVLAPLTETPTADLRFMHAAFLAGNLGGLGAALQLEDPSKQTTSLWLLGGGVSALTASALLGRGLSFSGPDYLQTAGSIGLGAWTGFWGLRALRPGHAYADLGGMALLSSLGFAAGSTLSAYTEPTYQEIRNAAVGFGVGTGFGAGLGLVIPELDDQLLFTLMLAGGWAGLGTAGFTGKHLDFSTGDGLFVLFGSGWGLYQALALREALGATDYESSRDFWGSMLLGSTTGAIGAGVLAQWIEPDASGVGRAAMGGLFGSVVGLGLELLVPEVGDRGPMSLTMTGGWAGLLTYALAMPPAKYTPADYLAVGVGGAWGLWQGYLIGTAAKLDGSLMDGAMTLGLGIGLLSGDAFARATDLDLSEVVFTELSSYAGSGLGAGLALLDEGSDSMWVAAAASAGSWAVKIAMGFFADEMKFRADDTFEYLFLQGYGTWQGFGFAMAADASDRRMRGSALIGLSAGFLIPMITNLYQDYSFYEDLLIAGGTGWGSWIGLWGTYAFSDDLDEVLLASLVGGDLGLVVSGLVLSDIINLPPHDMGWTQLIGIGGLALGASITPIFTRKLNYLAGGMALGSTVGLVVGAIWAGLTGPSSDQKKGGETEQPPAPVPAKDQLAQAHSNQGAFNIPFIRPAFFVLPPPEANQKAPPALMFGVEGLLE